MDLALTFIKLNVTLISLLRLDAQLYEFPVFENKKLGRNPIKGKRIQLKELLNDSKQVWQTDTINWYGGETRQIEYITRANGLGKNGETREVFGFAISQILKTC